LSEHTPPASDTNGGGNLIDDGGGNHAKSEKNGDEQFSGAIKESLCMQDVQKGEARYYRSIVERGGEK